MIIIHGLNNNLGKGANQEACSSKRGRVFIFGVFAGLVPRATIEFRDDGPYEVRGSDSLHWAGPMEYQKTKPSTGQAGVCQEE